MTRVSLHAARLSLLVLFLCLFLIASLAFGQTASLESSVADEGKPADFESCAARFEAAPDGCPIWRFEPALLELEKDGGYRFLVGFLGEYFRHWSQFEEEVERRLQEILTRLERGRIPSFQSKPLVITDKDLEKHGG